MMALDKAKEIGFHNFLFGVMIEVASGNSGRKISRYRKISLSYII